MQHTTATVCYTMYTVSEAIFTQCCLFVSFILADLMKLNAAGITPNKGDH